MNYHDKETLPLHPVLTNVEVNVLRYGFIDGRDFMLGLEGK